MADKKRKVTVLVRGTISVGQVIKVEEWEGSTHHIRTVSTQGQVVFKPEKTFQQIA